MIKSNPAVKIILCVGLFFLLLVCTASAQSETPGQYLDDSIITTKVKAAIFDEPSLKSLQIEVETYKGTVQLSGFVDSAASVEKAEDVARKVEGVKSVKNALSVK
ncbi:MAG: BON domain-containing protein [Desulfuromonadales bacterium]